jgi:hypothetical protein
VTKRLFWFVAGLALGLTAPATAGEVYLKCAPAMRETWSESCQHDNALATYFHHQGQIPSRCKIS